MREYITALADMLKCEPGSLLKTKRGNNGGTWLHPKLAVRFAQWLDVRFAIWCDMQIDSIVSSHAGLDDWRTARIEAASRFCVGGRELSGPSLSIAIDRQQNGPV